MTERIYQPNQDGIICVSATTFPRVLNQVQQAIKDGWELTEEFQPTLYGGAFRVYMKEAPKKAAGRPRKT